MIELLDSLVREIVRLRDNYCITCKRHRNAVTLEVGHFIPRRYQATRWDLRNCHAQCMECNRNHHGMPEAYRHAIGKETAEELWRIARSTPKTDKVFIRDILKEQILLVSER